MSRLSALATYRSQEPLILPQVLRRLTSAVAVAGSIIPTDRSSVQQLVELFPKTIEQPIIRFVTAAKPPAAFLPLRIGILLSGGQAAGGHNVIAGLFDALKQLNPNSVLLGFRDGASGVLNNHVVEITKKLLIPFRNQGGFDLLGSGRTKISTAEQLSLAKQTVEALHLDGLVVVGGDDSNTNAAILAEYFLSTGCPTRIVGIPKTIDGDLKNDDIEVSFGFDSAAKTYSDIIGNIARDALSAKKYYYFIRVMGRSASHLALECALQTQPNLTLISEEIAAKQMTLQNVTEQICDMIATRAAQGKHYGVILIPEGIIEFIPEVRNLINELNFLLSGTEVINGDRVVIDELTEGARHCFLRLPEAIQKQLLLDRDPHGNVQVSKIETERLFISLVEQELQSRRRAATYFGKFSAQSHFCGYEGRSCLPSYFDSHYCYALGHVAVLLVSTGYTGYMCCLQRLTRPVEEWIAGGLPLVSMMWLEQRNGKVIPVVRKALVDLNGEPFHVFEKARDDWIINDQYLNPGPMQFFGPKDIVQTTTRTMRCEAGKHIGHLTT